jgi:hypothetical protein
MLSGDTVVLTHDGFKTVKELNLYDEIMTPFGDFEPIVEMGPWEVMNNEVVLSTGEAVVCSDTLLWHVNDNKYKYTDELLDGEYACSKIFELGQDGLHPVIPAYDYAVVVPTSVPDAYILSSIETRLAFVGGLIDSPICEIGSRDGIYKFYTQYINLLTGMIALFRSLGWSIKLDFIEGVYCITLHITSHMSEIPIKDELKKSQYNCPTSINIRVQCIKDCSNKGIMGRKIRVNGGLFLIGYSFIPVG